MNKILLVNGPNLNLLGTREPEVYGSSTLDDVVLQCQSVLKPHGMALDHFQSNHEGHILDRLHDARTDGTAFIVINPGALTHTSIALRDALSGISIPFVEIHISNIHKRETFRQHSYLSDIAVGVICGLGVQGYTLAMQAALNQLESN